MKKHITKKTHKTTRANLESRFEAGDDVMDYFDLENAIVRVNVDFPAWVVHDLDRESARRGIARQALVKTWITDRLDALRLAPKRSQSSLKR